MSIHIHAEKVIVETESEWIDASGIEIKRTGDTLEVRIALVDGRYMNLTKYEVKDGKAIGLECKGWVRVNPEVIPPVPPSAQGVSQ